MRSEFTELGARVAGVSADPADRQQEFAEKNDLDFPLLSDPDREVARQFGAKRVGRLPSKRMTFVIGPDRRLLAAIKSEINMSAHADEALAVLRGDPEG